MKFAIIAAYIVLMLVLGWVGMKKTKTIGDFVLGGRTMGPWISSFSYGTTYFSAVVFIGYAGKLGWGFGLSTLWIVIGNAVIGCFLAWKLLAKPLHNMTVRLKAITMPEFLRQRYDSKAIKLLAALIIFVFLVPYTSSVYSGLSYLFESVFGIPYILGLIIIAGVTAFYLVMGGYKAVALADLFQGIVMIFGVLFLLYFVVGSPQVGGFANIIPKLTAIDPKLTSPVGPPGVIQLVALVTLTSLGTWGMPQMTQKFYAIKDERVVKSATWVTFLLSLWVAFGAYFTGSLSHLFFNNLDAVGGNVDRIVPTMLQQTMPSAVLALILVLVLAASMSTLSSLVLVSSSSVAVDFMQVAKPDLKKSTQVVLMRILCVAFVALSFFIAMDPPSVIVNLMAFSWGAVSGSFIAPMIWGLFSKKTTKAGAMAGMLSGLCIAVIGTALVPAQTAVVSCCAMVIPLAVVPIVSQFTKPFSQEHLDRVFGEDVLSLQKKANRIPDESVAVSQG